SPRSWRTTRRGPARTRRRPLTDDARVGAKGARGSLAGSVAMVTGAAGALVSAICLDLAQAGGDVEVHHLRQDDEARALCRELQHVGVRALAVSADVTDWDEVAAALAYAEAELGPIDILVNNAGWMESRRLVDTDLDQWRRTMSVDLDGV